VLDQSKGQLTLILVLMRFHEIRDRIGKFAHLQIAAATQFASDVFGEVFRPALAVLKATTRTGLLYFPVGRSRQARPNRPKSSATK
jgi:hypothetical protein